VPEPMRITVHYKRTKNVAPYETEGMEATLSTDVLDPADMQAEYDRAVAQVKSVVKDALGLK
jgi:hypothetical protein